MRCRGALPVLSAVVWRPPGLAKSSTSGDPVGGQLQ